MTIRNYFNAPLYKKAMRSSAPGKIILFGEHAVVYGEPAIAIAVDLRIDVETAPASTYTVNGYPLDDRHHQYIKTAIEHYWHGEKLAFKTKSQIPSASNLGSSSALTIAVTGSLLGPAAQQAEVARCGFDVERTAQGMASPIDTSVVTHGSGVWLTNKPEDDLLWDFKRGGIRWCVHHLDLPPLVFVAGCTMKKSKTPIQVERVGRFVQRSGFARDVLREMGELSLKGVSALRDEDLQTVGRLMLKAHDLLAILGVNTPELQRLVDAAKESAYGAKITGAGGGGSMIALTDNPQETADAIRRAGGAPYILRVEKEGLKFM